VVNHVLPSNKKNVSPWKKISCLEATLCDSSDNERLSFLISTLANDLIINIQWI
jgi:hypothetical protein